MSFIPDNESVEIPIPFFEEVMGRSDEGWSGHATTKTIEWYKTAITAALSRLGGMVTGFMKGKIKEGSTNERIAMRISYVMLNDEGDKWPGEMVVAGLPVNRKRCQNNTSYEKKQHKSLVMALHMTLIGLKGAWNMKVLSPGYAPLIPWMIAPGTKGTMSAKFTAILNKGSAIKLLPEPEMDNPELINGVFKEINE